MLRTYNKNQRRVAGQGVGIFIFLTVASFLVWSNMFYLDVAIRAQGSVIAQSRAQVVQAPDGGVLEKLFVWEGDHVKEGQELAQLEENRAAASLGELNIKLESLSVAKVRAEAQANLQEPDFSGFSDEVADVIAAQKALYAQHSTALESNIDRQNQALTIAGNEAESAKNLIANGDISRKEANNAHTRMIEEQGKLDKLYADYQSDARKEVAEIEAQMAALRYEIKNGDVGLQYTRINSPVDGIVTILNINTLGAVLRPGDQLLQISPTDGNYIVEVKVRPADIGQLHLGLPASVKLASYDYSIYGSLEGVVTYISADTIPDKVEGGQTIAFYRVQIKVDPDAQNNPRINAKEALKPGVTTTVDIRTGKRTVMEFLAKPITRAFGGAMTQY